MNCKIMYMSAMLLSQSPSNIFGYILSIMLQVTEHTAFIVVLDFCILFQDVPVFNTFNGLNLNRTVNSENKRRCNSEIFRLPLVRCQS